MDGFLLAGIACAFLAAGAVKGVAGMGLPTVALGVLGLIMSPAAAAPLLIAPLLVTNLIQCFGSHWQRLWPRLAPMWLGIPLGVLTTPFPGLSRGGEEMRLALGIVLLSYGAYGLLAPQLTLRASRWRLAAISLATGYATGLVTAASGIFVFPMMVFLQALALGKDEMIQALGLSFTVCTFSLWIAVGWSEAVRAGLSVPGAIAVAAALAGVWAGTHLRDKVPLGTFRKMLFVMFGVLGLTMMAR